MRKNKILPVQCDVYVITTVYNQYTYMTVISILIHQYGKASCKNVLRLPSF